MWATMGSGVWGLTWMGELVELAALVVIATGFFKKASYYFERQKIQSSGEKNKPQNEMKIGEDSSKKAELHTTISIMD